jgi:hypothetical protein
VSSSGSFSFSASFGLREQNVPSPSSIRNSSAIGWDAFWTESGFVDVMTGSTDSRAEELQRRIILSRYLMRVNEAGDTPPQEVRIT